MEESTTATTAAPTQASSTNDSEENYNFDSSLSEEERRFYLRAYPTVDLVRERKVHCTICKMHIGTAPCQEEIIRMHPVLRVTHCVKCHEFYNSGEFSKGEDGSELYCRWCGQGGEVYCCSSCPYVFCKSCIVKNLSRGVVVDIEQNENWNCFSCAPKILWPLRAQHWALIRFIEKQKKTIEECQSNESAKKVLYQKDVSTCCRLAKSKCGNMSDSNESLDSATSRRSQSGSSTKKPAKSPAQAPAPKRIKTSNDEVVCTPDLLSMLEPDCQITVQQKTGHTSLPMTSTPKMLSLQTHSSSPSGITLKPHNNTPPPLVLRNTGLPMRHPSPAPIVRRTIIGARNTTNTGHTPVYHTINGYRIDLNSAAQQETFRLPNGKLIQVKRQGTNPTQHNTPSPNNSWMRQASPITIQHAGSGRPVQITPTSSQYYTVQQHQQHQQNSMPHAQMIRCYSNSTLTNVGSQNGGVRGTQIQLINGVPVAPTATPASVTTANATTAVRAPLMVRHVFPDTAIGQARSQLQDQVFNAMEICQHLTGKVQTLTNSNAYKQARNYLEVKELYIHLSYLLTYAIGRFKGLQDKCLGDMRQLGFVNDADSLENGQLAAGVDYVRYGQLEDIDLFNTSANSFHNQVYEYRKSLHANLENGEGDDKKPPLSPLMPLGQSKLNANGGEDDEDYVENDEMGDNSWLPDALDGTNEYNDTEQSYYNDRLEAAGNEEVEATADMDDEELDADGGGFEQYAAQQQSVRYSNKAHYGTEDYMSQEEQTHARDRKLAALIRKLPAIWCTRHPDYGNFEVTRKLWRTVSSNFKRTENIKLRWKNIRKRYVRVERRVRDGKRFNGYFDKTTNFLANRDLPEDQWIEVDCGTDDEDGGASGNSTKGKGFDLKKKLNEIGKPPGWNDCIPAEADNFEMPEECNAKPIEVRALDMKIMNFVKCNPVLWRKPTDVLFNQVEEKSRKYLWKHLWKNMRLQSNLAHDLTPEDIMERWSHLYEMYKSFRLKSIKDEKKRANLELKYSKYLAKLYFLYKIVEEDLRNEHLNNIDIDFTKESSEGEEDEPRLQDEHDDKEFMLQLVHAVHRYPMLWDQTNNDYSDTVLRANIWEDIASELKDFKHKQASDDEDNEIEIVEPKTDTITLDSDNEDEAQPSKQIVSPKKPQMQSVATSTISNTPLLRQQCQQSPSISPDNIRQKLILKEHLSLPKGTTIMPATLAPAPKPVPVPVPVPSLVQISTPKSIGTITINKPQDKMEEVDMMTAAKTFLVSLLEVDSDTGEGGSDSTQQQQRKQPRKKTTNKPNPTLLKQKEMLERERLEEMKRNDLKLKMKCAISLKKAEEEYPFAKDMLERHENESKTDAARVVDAAEIDEAVENNENDEKKDMKDGAEIDSTKQDDAANENDGGGDVEILTVDLESSIEEDKENENEMLDGKESPTDKNVEDHSKEFTIVMDDDDDDKEKSLIIEVEGGTNSGEKEPLKVVIDAKTINENSGDKWVANDKTVGVGDKNAKNKLETVSECAKRVIESLQASEKRKEMEKKEISKKEPSGNTVTTTSAPATPATRSSSTELPTDDVTVASVDDTIEPILIDESDVGDSVDSPMKQNKQSSEVANMETTVTEKKQAGTAGYVDMSTTKTTITTTKKDGLIACAIKAATDYENIAELNEPEIDVEKEIEALLMNKSEGPENERNAGADTPSIADAAQTDQTPTAKTDTSVLLSDSVDNLMESESAAALT